MNDLTKELRDFALKAGADLVGIAPAEGWGAPKGHNPTDLMPHAKTVVVTGIRVLDWVIDHGLTKSRVDHQHLVLRLLEENSFEVGRWLSDRGFDVFPSDELAGFESELGTVSQAAFSMEWMKAFERSPEFRVSLYGDIPYVLAGYKAGLGTTGKSGFLITPQFGPRVLLSTVITNAPLEADKPMEADFCKDCQVCAKTCLGQAITERGYDAAKCWRAESVHGENVAGYNFRVCPAPCRKSCPVGKLKTKYRA